MFKIFNICRHLHTVKSCSGSIGLTSKTAPTRPNTLPQMLTRVTTRSSAAARAKNSIYTEYLFNHWLIRKLTAVATPRIFMHSLTIFIDKSASLMADGLWKIWLYVTTKTKQLICNVVVITGRYYYLCSGIMSFRLSQHLLCLDLLMFLHLLGFKSVFALVIASVPALCMCLLFRILSSHTILG
jgi:hypothetical protein